MLLLNKIHLARIIGDISTTIAVFELFGVTGNDGILDKMNRLGQVKLIFSLSSGTGKNIGAGGRILFLFFIYK